MTPANRLTLKTAQSLLVFAVVLFSDGLRGGYGVVLGLALMYVILEMERWALRGFRR